MGNPTSIYNHTLPEPGSWFGVCVEQLNFLKITKMTMPLSGWTRRVQLSLTHIHSSSKHGCPGCLVVQERML
jgi:hypothetical protein